MVAHTPTIFASVALVAMVMAFCLMLTGQFKRRDGMLIAACGLLSHALAYVCYTVYAEVPLWLGYGVANTLLALALAFYSASIFRIRSLAVPWRTIFALPALMALALAVLIDTREPRMFAAALLLSVQCTLIMHWAWRHGRGDGRAHLLLIIGSAISLIGLLLRIVAILTGKAPEMLYSASNFTQTVSVSIGTVTVIMYSLGLVLMSKERSEAILHHMALRDPLTGILNRRAILDQFSHELERARRLGSPLALAMVDIDNFKQINDIYGHLCGDEALRHCVGLITTRLRQSDSIGRYGGEEFLLLLPDTTPAGAYTVLEDLRAALATTPAHCADSDIALSFSAGLWCDVPDASDTPSALCAQADAALYRAKNAGRNTICTATN